MRNVKIIVEKHEDGYVAYPRPPRASSWESDGYREALTT
jgi:hypothetical protein